MKLDGKVALVTGVGPNIGQAIARCLAEAGAKVACNDVRADQAEAVAAEITQAGGTALAIPCDVTSESAVEQMVAKTVAAFGGVDILVNNAFKLARQGLLESTLADWENVLRVILNGTFLTSRAVAKQMVTQGRGGSIVHIASTSGHRGRSGDLAYCTAKGGILNLTRAMAMDLVQHGIRVNSVTPTKTGLTVEALKKSGNTQALKLGRNFYADIPMDRLGDPFEIAKAVLFFASDDSSFCTGTDLRADGGSLATWSLQADKLERLAP
jgi:NAD(P)-dependent dehydrogenase (short-subunit alcohol dehydrogenase family)